MFDIDPATKTKLLNERIQQLNVEGFQHELNLKTAQAIGNEAGITEANNAIAIIQTAIEVAQTELGA